MSAEASPKIVIVDESPVRAAILEEGCGKPALPSVVHVSEMHKFASANLLSSIPT